ncbi:hypothetical protein GCM10009663_16770 [Kitasatospora arboriphila]|uniref:Uncharacterized protein n=1 Tax=Kitasatospora arboriphila TaxID=258052 RepID=A0ABP4DZC9_9ACTN
MVDRAAGAEAVEQQVPQVVRGYGAVGRRQSDVDQIHGTTVLFDDGPLQGVRTDALCHGRNRTVRHGTLPGSGPARLPGMTDLGGF